MDEEFKSVISENQRLIYKVCRMYRSHAEDIQDLYQDIVLQLWRAFPSFKGESKISTWIYRISLNTSITQLRRKNNQPIHQSITPSMNDTLPNRDHPTDDIDHLNNAIAQLTDIDKAIILLYMEAYSYREMAEMIGITESNVGFKIHQIKKKLKNIIKR